MFKGDLPRAAHKTSRVGIVQVVTLVFLFFFWISSSKCNVELLVVLCKTLFDLSTCCGVHLIVIERLVIQLMIKTSTL